MERFTWEKVELAISSSLVILKDETEHPELTSPTDTAEDKAKESQDKPATADDAS